MSEMIWKDEHSAPEAVKHLESPNALTINVTDRKLVGLLNELSEAALDSDVKLFPNLMDMIKKSLTNVKKRFSIPDLLLVLTFTRRQVTVKYDPKKKSWIFHIEKKG